MASTSTATEIPSSPPPPPQTSQPPLRNYEEIATKRREIEKSQNQSLINGFDLQPHATKILESKDTSSLQETITNFINSKKPSFRTILKSLAYHYPNAFAFKLAKLLNLHPSFPIRTETVSILLSIFKESNKLNFTPVLIKIKEPLLNSLKIESNESILRPLCETIGLVAARIYHFPLGGWLELLQYVCDCFSRNTKLNHMKALIMLAELPEDVAENREFWLGYGYYDVLFSNLLKFVNSPDQEWRELTFNASLIVIKMSRNLARAEVCDSLLPVLLRLIELQYGGDDDLLDVDLSDMVKRLGDLVTLDIKEIFNGKESDVFWLLLRVAEREDVSDEIKCAVVTVIKELDEANSDAMESVIKKIRKKEIRRVISVAMDMMSCVVDDPVWYDVDNKICEDAGLTENFNRGKYLLNLLSFDGDERVFVPVAIQMLERKYAIHGDWRVRYAAMLTIAAIAERNFKGDMIKYIDQAVTLVHKSLNDMNHRVYAVIAIRFLVTNCGLEKINSFGEEIVVLLLKLLKHEKQKLQEEVIETLKSVALLMPVTFCQNHYDKFKEHEVLVIVESLISIGGKLSDTDHLARYVILKALDLFCVCQRVNIDKFIDQIMPMLLTYAQLDLNLTTSMPMDLSLDDDKNLVEMVRVQTCNVLSCCADRSAEKISPNAVEVTNIFLRWIGCSSFETRKACMLGLPKLLPLIKEGVIPKKDKIEVARRITLSVIEALGKETDSDLSKRMFRLLPKCIKTSGSFSNIKLLSVIVDGINQALKKIMENEIKRVKEAGTSEEEGDFLPTQETIKDAGCLIATTTETFKNGLCIDRLMKNVALFLETNMPDRVIVFAISIFNILVPQFPENLQPHHDKYIIAACHALRNDIPHSQPHAIRAIGICAEFGKDQFNLHLASVSVSRLYNVAGCDTAVEALGKICEYHRDKIEGSKIDPKILFTRAAVIGHFVGGSNDRNGYKVERMQLL
ncbi:hypothetical protein TSUD_123260 [Trifolium subterraneum]|uniref:Uncharacterized protein n=1 Tax=Trifolium subterraneum TaxID=3900 RepID=A0A2Z6LWB7_TRISU|nr:hypothetical protein TSUD_123260 [Trifolium subterraneum]